MSEARIDRISNENSTAGPIISGITTFSGQNYFVPPKGTTAERPSNCPPGSIRFNTDSAKLEYFDSLQWLEMEAFNVELGISTAAAPASSGTGHRGVFAGGYAPTVSNVIQYVTISTLGNTIRFGDLTQSKNIYNQCVSSTTRGVWGGGYGPGLSPVAATSQTNVIEYITISSTGNAADFGDLTLQRSHIGGCSTSTRGIFGAGYVAASPAANTNVIDYITIASTGNAVDYGDLNDPTRIAACFASTTRGVWAGGENNSQGRANAITYITISTTGNSLDFGDLNNFVAQPTSCSNSTRGLVAGGQNPAVTNLNNIDYITIATTGNAQDFGDLITGRFGISSNSSPTRGIFGGGGTPTNVNIMEYVTISTTGNTIDFGDLIGTPTNSGACSNGHGGL